MNKTHSPGSQRKKSMRSCYRNIPGAKDTGQRYVVTYRDGMGEKREYGFTNDIEEAREWKRRINANPTWNRPTVRDRQTGRMR